MSSTMEDAMTETEYSVKLSKLDELLNDPDVPMQPTQVWELLAEISTYDLSGTPAAAQHAS